MYSQEQMLEEKKLIDLTISSPVNVSVYYNSKSTLLMAIDLNTGISYDNKQFMSEDTFKLIFVSKGFEKSIKFIAKPADGPATYEFDLGTKLSLEEIINSYDRDSALDYIATNPNAYAYEQLQSVGEEIDVELLHNELIRLSTVENSDNHNDYLIACCALSLGKNAIKYEKYEELDLIRNVYVNYGAKDDYGYIFEKFINYEIPVAEEDVETSDTENTVAEE